MKRAHRQPEVIDEARRHHSCQCYRLITIFLRVLGFSLSFSLQLLIREHLFDHFTQTLLESVTFVQETSFALNSSLLFTSVFRRSKSPTRRPRLHRSGPQMHFRLLQVSEK